MQRVLGYSAMEVGLGFLPVSLIIGALSLGFSARLNMRFGPRAVLLPGLAMCVVGLLLFSRVPVHGTYAVDLLPSMLLFGVGAGLSFPALTILAMSGATSSDAGLASGLINTTLQVGGALGLSILAALSTSRTNGLLAGGEDTATALTGGYHAGFAVAAAFVGAAILLAITVLRPPAAVVPDMVAVGEEPPELTADAA
jgi:MFS family permease